MGIYFCLKNSIFCPLFYNFITIYILCYVLFMYNYVPYLSFLSSGIGLLFIFYIIIRFHQYSKSYWLIGIIASVVYMEFYIYGLTSKHIYQMLFLFRSSNIIRAFLPIFCCFMLGLWYSHNIKLDHWNMRISFFR